MLFDEIVVCGSCKRKFSRLAPFLSARKLKDSSLMSMPEASLNDSFLIVALISLSETCLTIMWELMSLMWIWCGDTLPGVKGWS